MDINNELVLQEPIIFQGITIHQPTIKEIFSYGINEYNSLLVPYMVSLDLLDIEEEQKQQIKAFDLIICNEDIFSYLLVSLKILCRTDSIAFMQNCIMINDAYLDRDNFDEFSDIILKIHAREKPKQDKLPDNPRQRELELKFREFRAKRKNKNEFLLCDIINIVKYGGNYHITTKEIKDMTLWELTNAYNAKLGVSQYESMFQIALVAGDKEHKLEDNHWTQLLKVGK